MKLPCEISSTSRICELSKLCTTRTTRLLAAKIPEATAAAAVVKPTGIHGLTSTYPATIATALAVSLPVIENLTIPLLQEEQSLDLKMDLQASCVSWPFNCAALRSETWYSCEHVEQVN